MPATPGLEPLALLVVAAAVLGILFQKLKQPTIIAYIVTGLLLGPVGLGMVSKTGIIDTLAELGLVFLLFLIGLEIKLDEIKQILKPVTVIAVFQMALTAIVGYFLAQFLGFNYIESLVVAAASMFSSTAVVVKLLADRDEISTLPGKIDVGILLIQDLAVVLILTVLGTGAGTPLGIAVSVAEIAIIAGLIGSLSYISSLYVLPRIFRKISENRHAFFVHGIAWAFVLITVAAEFGVSREIGAFIAGLSLAQIPYSRELQERVRPLTDFLMAVFFINIGLSLTQGSLGIYWKEALLASAILMVSKFGIIMLLVDRAKFTPETSFKASLNMSQISEFSLILGGLTVTKGLVGPELLGFLSIVAITTMGASSYLVTFNRQIVDRVEHILERLESEEKEDFETREIRDHAVVIGYDRLSKKALPALKEHFQDVIVIDRNPMNTSELAESDYEYIYGDFKHSEIRNTSRVKDADFILCLAPDPWVNRKAAEDAPPDATLFLKAGNMEEAAELYDMGANYVIVKNIIAGEKMSQYLQLYLEDRDLFKEEVKDELESIHWGGNRG